MKKAIFYIKFVYHLLKILKKYGLKAVMTGQEIYEDVEYLAKRWGEGKGSEKKAAEFDSKAKIMWKNLRGVIPFADRISEFREDIWASQPENFKKKDKDTGPISYDEDFVEDFNY